MKRKFSDKLKKKKGKLSRSLDTSRKFDISKDIVTVIIAEDFHKKKELNGKIKKDKNGKFKKKIDLKRQKLIEKVNKMRNKNKKLDKLIMKLKMRRTKIR